MKKLLAAVLIIAWLLLWTVIGVVLEKNNINHNNTMTVGAFLGILLSIVLKTYKDKL